MARSGGFSIEVESGEVSPYLHQRFFDGHEHLHIAIHPRWILEVETPPYGKKRAIVMKNTIRTSQVISFTGREDKRNTTGREDKSLDDSATEQYLALASHLQSLLTEGRTPYS